MLRRFVASKVFVMLLRELIVHDHTSMILLTVKVILSLDALNLHLGCVWSEAYCYETVILLCGVTGKMQALGQQERNVRSAMKRSANGNSRFTGTRVAFIGNSPWVAKSLQSLLFCIERKSMLTPEWFVSSSITDVNARDWEVPHRVNVGASMLHGVISVEHRYRLCEYIYIILCSKHLFISIRTFLPWVLCRSLWGNDRPCFSFFSSYATFLDVSLFQSVAGCCTL